MREQPAQEYVHGQIYGLRVDLREEQDQQLIHQRFSALNLKDEIELLGSVAEIFTNYLCQIS